jgi:hypothetical protein
MEPISTFCLAAIVFLSLPLPLFASAALGTCPSARRSLMPWVWGNAIVGSAAGLLIVATPLPPWMGLAIGSTAFLVCGMQMFFRLGRRAASQELA